MTTTALQQLPGVREHAAQTVRRVLSDPGESLPAGLRSELEPRFNTDFSAVRVHSGPQAQASAHVLNANAYTAGSHVVFGKGGFAPDTGAGRELLTHELAHTVQQQGATGVPTAMTAPHGSTETNAHTAAAQARAGTVPTIAPVQFAIAREEGTAQVIDTATNYGQIGSVYSAQMRRDQYRTAAEAQQAGAAHPPPIMDTGWANISIDTTTGAISVPVTVAVRAALPNDSNVKQSGATLPGARVQAIGDQYIRQVNEGLNGWFTLTVPACKGVPFAGRDLAITVNVTRTTAPNPDFTIAVSPDGGRSYVSNGQRLVMLYASDLDRSTMRHEGSHMALGLPDEYEETDAALRKKYPLQKGDERVRQDFTLAGESSDWGIFAVLRERHFSFVPTFVNQVLASMGHPECRSALREVNRPQPSLMSMSIGVGGSDYRGGAMHLEAGLDRGRFLDRDRRWRAFLGVHGQTEISAGYRAPSAFLLGARIGIERRWRPAQVGPVAGVYGETGVAGELGPGAHGLAPFVGAGAHVGVGVWGAGGEFRFELAGGEVLRLDRESYQSFHAGLIAGYSW